MSDAQSVPPSASEAGVTADEALGRFITRLRLIASHSLAQDREHIEAQSNRQLNIQMKFNRRTGDFVGYETSSVELLSTEQIESAIARVRPLLLENDGISYKQVLGKLDKNLNDADRQEVSKVRKMFETFDPDHPGGRPKAKNAPGDPVTNKQIAGSWLYGNLVHADAIRQSYSNDLSFELVFMEAQRTTCGLVLASLCALDLLKRLWNEQKISVNDSTFTDDVVAREQSWSPRPLAVWTADQETPMPTSLQEPLGEAWTPLEDEIATQRTES